VHDSASSGSSYEERIHYHKERHNYPDDHMKKPKDKKLKKKRGNREHYPNYSEGESSSDSGFDRHNNY